MELHVSILGVHGALASSLRLQVRREQDLVLDSHGRATFYVRFLLDDQQVMLNARRGLQRHFFLGTRHGLQ